MFAGRIPIAGLVALLALAGAAGLASTAENGVQFIDPLTKEPLEIELPPDASEEVKSFFETGDNPYHGDQQAIAEGRQLYNRWCASCHMPDGSGRMGPSLIDDTWKYERAATAVGPVRDHLCGRYRRHAAVQGPAVGGGDPEDDRLRRSSAGAASDTVACHTRDRLIRISDVWTDLRQE